MYYANKIITKITDGEQTDEPHQLISQKNHQDRAIGEFVEKTNRLLTEMDPIVDEH